MQSDMELTEIGSITGNIGVIKRQVNLMIIYLDSERLQIDVSIPNLCRPLVCNITPSSSAPTAVNLIIIYLDSELTANQCVNSPIGPPFSVSNHSCIFNHKLYNNCTNIQL